MLLIETIILIATIFFSVTSIASFAGAMLECSINKINAEYGLATTSLIITSILWGAFYYLTH